MPVPCNGCRLCCMGDAILLRPEDRTDYITQDWNGHTILAHAPNGNCVYLGPTGCTIYEKRPLVCRTFDCADMVHKTSKPVLREMVKQGIASNEVIARGKHLWKIGYRPDGWKQLQARRRAIMEKARGSK